MMVMSSPARLSVVVLVGLTTLAAITGCGGGTADKAKQATDTSQDAAADTAENDGSGGSDSNAAVDCTSDDNCTGGEVCNSASGACVACNVALDCANGGNAQGWLCSDHVCVARVACGSDKACSAQQMVCDKVAGYCVDCVIDAECDADLTCKAHTCTPPAKLCQSSKDCAADGQICNKKLGVCADCAEDDDCLGGEHCADSVCVSDACEVGKRLCKNNSTIQICKTGRSGWVAESCVSGTSCKAGVCKSQICAPKATFCKGTKAWTCAADGLGSSLITDCDELGPGGMPRKCVNGACLASTCTPGETSCTNETVLSTCDSSGSGWTQDSCSGTTPYCFGKACVSCKVGTKFCPPGKTSAIVLLCNSAGTDAEIAETCTQGSVCVDGACGAVPKTCTPGAAKCEGNTLWVCTIDGKTWATTQCKGAKACTTVTCDAGIGGCAVTPVSCDDGNPCTTDACAEPGGCSHTPGGTWCDDGDACTKLGTCQDGKCASGEVVNCDDGNACTADVCDKTKGCDHTSKADGASCDDGNACTSGDVCKAGKCGAGKSSGWQMLVGGTQPDYFTHAAAAKDGSVYLGGYSNSIDLPKTAAGQGGSDAWFARIDSGGKLLWSKLWGGAGLDKVTAVSTLANGGAAYSIASGSPTLPGGLTNGGGVDAVVVLIDATGKVGKIIQYAGNSTDVASAVLPLADGSLIVGGSTQSTTNRPGNTKKIGYIDLWLVSYGPTGALTWAQTWGVKGYSKFELGAMAQRPGGGFALAGGCASADLPKKVSGDKSLGGWDGVLLLVDANGKLETNRRLGGNSTDKVVAIAARKTDYVLAGYSLSKTLNGAQNSGGYDGYIAAVNEQGQLLWERLIGGKSTDFIYDIVAQADGTLSFIGASASNPLPGGPANYGGQDAWFGHTTANGVLLSAAHYGGTASDRANAMVATADGWLLVGASASLDNPAGIKPKGSYDGWLIATNAKGEATCAKKP